MEILHINKKRKYGKAVFRQFFGQSFLGFRKMDKKNVQKSKSQNTLLKNRTSVTIIEFYDVVTKKIIFIL